VVAENVFTTNMAEFLKHSPLRNDIYKKQFPTGSWLEVKGLALPDFMIEIELEVHKGK
jgi:2-iminobutanoate/2-iminopropanoate deaminase